MNEALVCFMLVFLAFFFFMVLVTIDVYAFDYYQVSEFIWDEAPIVCINNPPDYKTYYGLKAVIEWRDRLPPSFDYRVLVGEHEECTVNIISVDNIPIDDFGIGPVGQSQCRYEMFTNEGVGYTMNVTMWCKVLIKRDTTDFGDTVKHEMGHVLGVGHRTIYNGTDIGKLVKTGDIMLSQIFGIQKIKSEALEVLTLIYGENGFEPPNLYNVVTAQIKHDEDRDRD